MGSYVLKGNQVTFELANYDKTRPLVIDPVLAYSTYLGGSLGNSGGGIAVDASGDVFVTGDTNSSDFPTTPGAFQTTQGEEPNHFVSKLNSDGSALLYSTYLGGIRRQSSCGGDANSIAVDASGNAYITGGDGAHDFPTTPGAFQTTLRGCLNAFVSKLNADGSALLYSTYLGGDFDYGQGIAVDTAGNTYVTGTTRSHFPTTPGAFQTIIRGPYNAFVSKLNADGSALLYSTYLGGSAYDFGSGIAVDASGNAYVTGYTSSSHFPTTPGAFQTTFHGGPSYAPFDAFVSKLNAPGSGLVYSTYLGGSDLDEGFGIAVDASGNGYVTGYTQSSDFPTTPGAFQTTYGGSGNGFISKLDAAGSALLYSTYIGGSSGDEAFGITVDSSLSAYVTGETFSADFPITPNALQRTFGGRYDHTDAFLSKLNATGSALLYSTYLGGSESDQGSRIAVDASSNAYVTGETFSTDFPITPGAFQTASSGFDAFVAKISFADAPGLALGPGELTFDPQAVGTTSGPQTVTLLDAGSQPLSITSIVTSGDFAQTDTCGSVVPSGTSCSISVTFTPTATGTRSGAVIITDNAAGSPHKLLLTGTGTGGPPAVTLAPASVPFLVLRTVGTTSLPQTVKLTNVGSGQLSINAITVTGADPTDFTQTNNCPATVASGGSCLITVTFKPTAQGVRTASVSITDNAPGSPQTVPLSGRGTFLNWSPRSLNMGNQPVGTSSPAQTVTLANVGSASIALFSIQVGGVNAGDFSQTNTCGSSLKAGARCTIQVTLTPTAVGSRLGHVAIRDSAFGGTHWVGLLGKGT